MAWFLFLLVVAAVTAVLVWDYRRKAAQREAASRERFEQAFKFDLRNPAGAPTPAAAPAHAPDAGVVPDPSPSAPPRGPVTAAAERFLDGPRRLAYLLLKAGMPDHEVFARVPLAALVGGAGSDADPGARLRRLSHYQVDYLICDRELRVVAAIDLDTGSRADAPAERQFKVDCLREAGVPLIRLDASSLPRKSEIRALVCGPAGAGGAGAPR